jgi:flagellar basal-body rod protein FlgB
MLFRTTTDVVVRGALDGLAARHRVHADNIANVDTPGFQPGEVSFEEQLRGIRDQLDRGGPAPSPPPLSLEVRRESDAPGRPDGNRVEVDREVVRLAENTLTYESLVQAARMRGGILRDVLNEGRK